jgi:hypothetical protein
MITTGHEIVVDSRGRGPADLLVLGPLQRWIKAPGLGEASMVDCAATADQRKEATKMVGNALIIVTDLTAKVGA